MKSEPDATSASCVFVNDQPHPLPRSTTLAGLLGELSLSDRKGVAVAVNGAVIPRSAWSGHTLISADRVLVIQATQGG